MPKRTVPQGEGKRIPLMMRTTRDMRDRMEAAAAASGRSLAGEAEYRLEMSFERDGLLEQMRVILRGERA